MLQLFIAYSHTILSNSEQVANEQNEEWHTDRIQIVYNSQTFVVTNIMCVSHFGFWFILFGWWWLHFMLLLFLFSRFCPYWFAEHFSSFHFTLSFFYLAFLQFHYVNCIYGEGLTINKPKIVIYSQQIKLPSR